MSEVVKGKKVFWKSVHQAGRILRAKENFLGIYLLIKKYFRQKSPLPFKKKSADLRLRARDDKMNEFQTFNF